MEQQILICNEPSPTSPSETNHRDQSSSSGSYSSTLSYGEISSSNNMKNRNSLQSSFNDLLLNNSSPDYGYESNSSIISSIHSNEDQQRRRKHEKIFTSKLIPTIEQQANNGVTIGQLDQNMLDDKQRILNQMLSIEDRYVPWEVDTKVYLSGKYETNEKIRHQLTEWMFEVCEAFKCEEGLFILSVNYLDRCMLAMSSIPKSQLQLVGIVCMLIASKICQCTSLDLNYLSYTTEYTFTVNDILAWEPIILKQLDWDISSVVATDYLDYIIAIVSKLLKLVSSNSQNDTDDEDDDADNESQTTMYQCRCLSQQNEDEQYNGKFSLKINHNNKRQLPPSYDMKNSTMSLNHNNNDHESMSPLYYDQYHSHHHHRHRYHHHRRRHHHHHHHHYHYHHSKRFKPDRNFDDDDDDDHLYEDGIEQFEHNQDRYDGHQSSLASSIETTIRRHANTFITICSTELSFVCVKPSVIATACVAAAIRGIIHSRKQRQQDFQSFRLSKTTPTPPSSSSMFIPSNLYKRFLLIVEKQTGIDRNCIETYAQQIENLTVSKLDSDMLINNSNSNNDNNDNTNMIPAETATAPLKKTSTHNNHHQHRNTIPTLTGTTSTSLIRNNNMISNGSSCLLANNHSIANNSTNNSYYYIQTTFAQVASAKQFLLRQENIRNNYNHLNIPRSSLHDTTNGGGVDGGNGGGNLDDSNTLKSHLTDLLVYLEREDRENIPLFIMDPVSAPTTMVQSTSVENQENMPPTSNDGINDDDDDDEILEDLCF